MTEKRFHTFSNGTEHVMWKDRNCFICAKGYDEIAREWRCDIEQEIDEDCLDDGGVSAETAARIGYTNEIGLEQVFRCKEFKERCPTI